MALYDEIVDEVVVPMSAAERVHLAALLDEPTDEFKRLVEILGDEGCAFSRQQASLMLQNTPGAADRLLRVSPGAR